MATVATEVPVGPSQQPGYSPEAAVANILETSSDAPATDNSAGQKTEAGESKEASSTPNSPPNTDTNPITEPGEANSKGPTAAEQLVETLHAANGPPEASPLAQTPALVAAMSSTGQEAGRVLRPGNSPGLMTINHPEIWSVAEEYEWEINDVDAGEGRADHTGWDLISITGSLQIQSLPGSPFTIKVLSRLAPPNNPDTAGPVADFDATKTYAWRIVHTTDGITGFDRSLIDLDISQFAASNNIGTGAFVLDLAAGGHDLVLRFLPALPFVQLNGASWDEQGPFVIQSSDPKEGKIAGAISALAVDPENPNIIFVGAVGGGVWLTLNGTDASPDWTPLTDALPSLAVNALSLSPFDRLDHPVTAATPVGDLVLYMGTGSFTSIEFNIPGLSAVGIFKSTDGGSTWKRTGTSSTSAILSPYRVTSIVTSASIPNLVFAGTADAGFAGGGLYKSEDGGDTWVHLTGNGLQAGSISDIVRDPTNPARFYVAVSGRFDLDLNGDPEDDASNPGNGIYRTDNYGGSWTPVNTGIRTSVDFDNFDTDYDGLNDQQDGKEGLKLSVKIRLAISPAGSHPIYAAVVGGNNQLSGVFRSDNAGGLWTPVGTPPPVNSIRQGMIHFSMAADPTDPNVVYVGGDDNPNIFRGDSTTAGLITFSLNSSDPTYGNQVSLPWVTVNVTSLDPVMALMASNFLANEIQSNEVESQPSGGLATPLGDITITESADMTVVREAGPQDTYTIVLKTQPTIPVRVNLDADSSLLVEDAAHPGLKYLEFTLNDWNVPQTVNVRAYDDGKTTGLRTAKIKHSIAPADPAEPPHLDTKLPEVTVRIAEGIAPGITVLPLPGKTSVQVTETQGPSWFTVVLNHLPIANVRINLISNSQVTAVDDDNSSNTYLDFTPANWDKPQKVRVTAVEDGVPEQSTWFSLEYDHANGTAPHPDSRGMAFDKSGDLLEIDDGGIYRFHNPHDPATRKWASINGNLRITEINGSVAWDAVTHTAIAGSQDNGVIEQSTTDPYYWTDVTGGDGNVVLVDSFGSNSIRYIISSRFTTAFRRVYDSGGNLVSSTKMKLRSAPDAADYSGLENTSTISPQGGTDRNMKGFQSIILALNAVDHTRLLLGRNALYESADGSSGDVITTLSDPSNGLQIHALAYGGMRNGKIFKNVIYVARGNQISVRSVNDDDAPGAFTSTEPPGSSRLSNINDIVLDPADWMTAFAVDETHVWVTTDAGAHWQDITLNLATISSNFKSLEIIRNGDQRVILAGTGDGVYILAGDTDGLNAGWTRIPGLPRAIISDIDYDPTDDLLVVGTRARGVWTLPNPKTQLFSGFTGQDLRIEGTGLADQIIIKLHDADAGEPPLLEITINNVVQPLVPLDTIYRIVIHGGDGDDTLTLDSSNGPIILPGDIEYDGGPGSGDHLQFEGPFAADLQTLTLNTVDQRRLDDTVVNTRNVEQFTNIGVLRPLLDITREGLGRFSDWTRGANGPDLLGRVLPIFGNTLGNGLSGARQNAGPLDDPRDGEQTQEEEEENEAAITPANYIGQTILRRLFQTGEGAFLLDQIGRTITTLADLRQAFDDLDNTPGNVTYTSQAGQTAFDITVHKTIAGEVTIAIDALGGLLQINGNLHLKTDAALHLILGVDNLGFYIQTDAFPDPELVLSNLVVDGEITGTGRFGFLGVKLSGGTLETNPGVKLSLNIKEPGPDPYTNTTDGRVRLYELKKDPAGLMDVTVTGTGNADLTLNGEFTVAATELDGEPLFDIGTATVKLIWDNINSPYAVRLQAVGGPAEVLTRFLNFTADDALNEIRRTANYLRQLSVSPLLDVRLPFGNGATLGATFNFSNTFLDKILAEVSNIDLVATPGLGSLSGSLALGKLSADAKFTVQIGDDTPVDVTVTLAAMGSNTGMPDLVNDINQALFTAGLGDKVLCTLDGHKLTLRLLEGAGLKITGDSNNPFFAELGIGEGQIGIELPKFPTLQELIGELEEALDPDGEEGPLTIHLKPNYDTASNEFTFNVIIGGIGFSKNISLKYDPTIGLGDLADVSLSGNFAIDATLDIAFTVGFDFNALTTPTLNTSITLPPPSSGRLKSNSTFTINLNDGDRITLPTLTLANTSTNNQLSDLVDDLNALLVGKAYLGTDLNKIVHFTQAKTGNAILFQVINEDLDADGNSDIDEDTNHNQILDPGEDKDNDGHLDTLEDKNANGLESWLNKVNSIAIEANENDPIFTEVGFTSVPARSTTKGLFLENTYLGGSLTLKASDIAANARFAIFGVSTSGGSATGTGKIALRFTNPNDKINRPSRIDLDLLLKHLSDITDYVSADTQLTGSIDIQLNHIKVSPDLPTLTGQPLIPQDSQVRVFIPDIKDLHYNPDPYNGSNTGTFVTYPELGNIGNFNCASFLDVASALDSLSQQLEGLKAFSFLSEPLPLINISVSDILDFAGNLASAFKKLAAGDTETIKTLETDLRNFFGLNANQLWIKVDDTPAPKTSGGTGATPATATFNPSGKNNTIKFTAGPDGSSYNDVKIDFVDDGSIPIGTDTATVSYDGAKKILTIHYNATYTTATTVANAVSNAHDVDANAMPFDAEIITSAGDTDANGGGVITETAIKFHLEYSLAYANFLPLQFNLGELVALVSDPTVKKFLAGVADLVQIEGSAKLNVTASATLALDFGLDVSSSCGPVPFLYDSTGLTLKAAIRGTALNLKIGIGAINASIKNGTATLDGDGDPNTTNDSATFAITFKDTDGDGRHYFRPGFFDLSNIGISLTAGASAVLPLYALGDLPLGSTSDNNHDNYPDNDLVVKIADLTQLFSHSPGNAIQLITPDVAALFNSVNVCDLAAHPELLVDGVDALLGVIQTGLGNKVFTAIFRSLARSLERPRTSSRTSGPVSSRTSARNSLKLEIPSPWSRRQFSKCSANRDWTSWLNRMDHLSRVPTRWKSSARTTASSLIFVSRSLLPWSTPQTTHSISKWASMPSG